MDPAGTAAGGCQVTAPLAGEDKFSLEKEAQGHLHGCYSKWAGQPKGNCVQID